MSDEQFSCICNYIARIGYHILSMSLDCLDICVVPHEIGYIEFAAAEASRKIIAPVLLIITSEFCQF